MIYGIQETTDHRSPETRIVRLSSVRAAQRWLADGGTALAWPGSVPASKGGVGGEDIPLSSQNFHHRLKSAYETPSGWRLPGVREWKALHHEDRRSLQKFQADEIRRHGLSIAREAT